MAEHESIQEATVAPTAQTAPAEKPWLYGQTLHVVFDHQWCCAVDCGDYALDGVNNEKKRKKMVGRFSITILALLCLAEVARIYRYCPFRNFNSKMQR